MIEDAVNPEDGTLNDVEQKLNQANPVPGTNAYIYQKSGELVAAIMNDEITPKEADKASQELSKMQRELTKKTK